MTTVTPLSELENCSEFVARHVGITPADEALMLGVVGAATRAALIEGIVPRSIARSKPMDLPPPVTEAAALAELKAMAGKNKLLKSFIGQGYYGTHTPGVILRNILENPAWYTAYTPYQAEISQGRMEALVNFQTMVCDLTAMPMANASMLDEATAAAEAMTLAKRSSKSKSAVFIVAADCHPQTIEVVQTRAAPLGIQVKVGFAPELMSQGECFGGNTNGSYSPTAPVGCATGLGWTYGAGSCDTCQSIVGNCEACVATAGCGFCQGYCYTGIASAAGPRAPTTCQANSGWVYTTALRRFSSSNTG